ncbi:hypothetical protein HDV05_003405 [Chytridiales sp. JEL 0842]|nr:hypothetical protein HDV05_003405 [Chytridiales sp. JEL 0842]
MTVPGWTDIFFGSGDVGNGVLGGDGGVGVVGGRAGGEVGNTKAAASGMWWGWADTGAGPSTPTKGGVFRTTLTRNRVFLTGYRAGSYGLGGVGPARIGTGNGVFRTWQFGSDPLIPDSGFSVVVAAVCFVLLLLNATTFFVNDGLVASYFVPQQRRPRRGRRRRRWALLQQQQAAGAGTGTGGGVVGGVGMSWMSRRWRLRLRSRAAENANGEATASSNVVADGDSNAGGGAQRGDEEQDGNNLLAGLGIGNTETSSNISSSSNSLRAESELVCDREPPRSPVVGILGGSSSSRFNGLSSPSTSSNLRRRRVRYRSDDRENERDVWNTNENLDSRENLRNFRRYASDSDPLDSTEDEDDDSESDRRVGGMFDLDGVSGDDSETGDDEEEYLNEEYENGSRGLEFAFDSMQDVLDEETAADIEMRGEVYQRIDASRNILENGAEDEDGDGIEDDDDEAQDPDSLTRQTYQHQQLPTPRSQHRHRIPPFKFFKLTRDGSYILLLLLARLSYPTCEVSVAFKARTATHFPRVSKLTTRSRTFPSTHNSPASITSGCTPVGEYKGSSADSANARIGVGDFSGSGCCFAFGLLMVLEEKRVGYFAEIVAVGVKAVEAGVVDRLDLRNGFPPAGGGTRLARPPHGLKVLVMDGVEKLETIAGGLTLAHIGLAGVRVKSGAPGLAFWGVLELRKSEGENGREFG